MWAALSVRHPGNSRQWEWGPWLQGTARLLKEAGLSPSTAGPWSQEPAPQFLGTLRPGASADR